MLVVNVLLCLHSDCASSAGGFQGLAGLVPRRNCAALRGTVARTLLVLQTISTIDIQDGAILITLDQGERFTYVPTNTSAKLFPRPHNKQLRQIRLECLVL